MTEVPPSRYRVIERDRRLVVIDTRDPGATRVPPAGTGAWLPRQVRFDGAAELTTRRFYDDKGPRTVRLDAGAARTLRIVRAAAVPAMLGIGLLAWAAPFLLIFAGALLNPKARTGVRAWITRWLDARAADGAPLAGPPRRL